MRMRRKKRGAPRKVVLPADDEQAPTSSADPHHSNWMEALNTILPTFANSQAHSPEELITAIAKLLRLKDITMEVLRDTSIGCYVRDLCDHPSVQVSSAARIALDCFQTVLFEWADSLNWSREVITKTCMEADREKRHKACKSARLATIGSTKQPVVLKGDEIFGNNNISNTNATIENDHHMGINMANLVDLPSCSSSSKEDSPYTPTDPSACLQKRVYPPQLAKKERRAHVHFPSPSIPWD